MLNPEVITIGLDSIDTVNWGKYNQHVHSSVGLNPLNLAIRPGDAIVSEHFPLGTIILEINNEELLLSQPARASFTGNITVNSSPPTTILGQATQGDPVVIPQINEGFVTSNYLNLLSTVTLSGQLILNENDLNYPILLNSSFSGYITKASFYSPLATTVRITWLNRVKESLASNLISNIEARMDFLPQTSSLDTKIIREDSIAITLSEYSPANYPLYYTVTLIKSLS